MTKSRGLRVSKGTRPVWVNMLQGLCLCQCGCGEPVDLKPEHYPNPPRFRHGHNPTRARRKPRPKRVPCQCGCGELTSPGKRFVTGHNSAGRRLSPEGRAKIQASKLGTLNPRFGKRPGNYVGRIYHIAGYVLIWIPGHPFASNGRVFEHRLIVEQHLRETNPDSECLIRLDGHLYLRPEIQVHHIDGVKDNNSIDNLVPLTASEHTRLHHAQRRR